MRAESGKGGGVCFRALSKRTTTGYSTPAVCITSARRVRTPIEDGTRGERGGRVPSAAGRGSDAASAERGEPARRPAAAAARIRADASAPRRTGAATASPRRPARCAPRGAIQQSPPKPRPRPAPCAARLVHRHDLAHVVEPVRLRAQDLHLRREERCRSERAQPTLSSHSALGTGGAGAPPSRASAQSPAWQPQAPAEGAAQPGVSGLCSETRFRLEPVRTGAAASDARTTTVRGRERRTWQRGVLRGA